MSFLCTVPDETHGTLAELNGSLSKFSFSPAKKKEMYNLFINIVGVEHSNSPGMQELANVIILFFLKSVSVNKKLY